MNYLTLLQNSYETHRQTVECPPESRLEFLADVVFQFTTYDGAMSVEFAARAVQVCTAITERATFSFIEDPECYRWFLLMINMPFFVGRLDWGTSIRGAWWGHNDTSLESCGLWSGSEQVIKLEFSRAEWMSFIHAVIEFAAEETGTTT